MAAPAFVTQVFKLTYTGTSGTQAITPTGDDSLVVVYVGQINNATEPTATYNGNDMGAAVEVQQGVGDLSISTVFTFVYANGTADGNPHNVIVTHNVSTNAYYGVQAWSGAAQTGIPDSAEGSAYNPSIWPAHSPQVFDYPTTVVADECMLSAFGATYGGGGYSGGTNTTFDLSSGTEMWLARSTVEVNAGAQELVINGDDSASNGIVISIAPPSDPPSANTQNLLLMGVG